MGVPQQVQFRINGGNRKPKGKRSAPKTENRLTGKKEPYAYIFSDPAIGEMPVLSTANAWWADATKVKKLVDAYKFYATDDQACYYAGINMGQLRYFQDMHPDFFMIKHAAKQDPTLRAKKTIVEAIGKSDDMARWWVERLEKDTFSTRQENTGPNGRDLYDGLTQEIKQIGEALRQEPDEEHPDKPAPADANAGQGGPGNEAKPAETASKG